MITYIVIKFYQQIKWVFIYFKSMDHIDTIEANKKIVNLKSINNIFSKMNWDKSSIKSIEKAILKSDLGINPSNDGAAIR